MEPHSANQCKRDLEILIRSRYPLINIVSWEEKRVMEALADIAARLGKRLMSWSCLTGLVSHIQSPQGGKPSSNSATRDAQTALREAADYKEPAIFVFKDLGAFLASGQNHALVRALREIALEFTTSFKTVILLGTHLHLPPALEKDMTVVDFPLPGPSELGELLDSAARDVQANPNLKVDLTPEGREELVKAAQGLTLSEAESVFARSLVVHGRLGAEQIADILTEKRQIIRKSGLLEYFDADVSIADVGGLENLKDWLSKRRLAFSDKAGTYGLPPPRGMLLLGVQGCGKSLCAKAVSAQWKLPLLRLDVGRIFQSLVGGSEENIRRAIGIAESVAPCILWVDEIEKAFGGMNGTSTDSGTSQRVLGTFLTWLAEKNSAVFVAATANNVANLPPELLRKGRFDEIFFVDLPDSEERKNILAIHLRRRGRNPRQFDLAALAAAAENFSGAEMEQAVVSGMFDAFSNGCRDVATGDILQALGETVPLSRTMEEEIGRLRSWCLHRARPASVFRRSEIAGGSRLAGLPRIDNELPSVEGERV